MSGGSLDYAYEKVNDAADAVRRRAETSLHRAFAKHLDKVSAALRALEWMLSGGTSEGSEIEAIKACLPKGAVLKSCTEEAREALANLKAALAEAETEARE